jgi:uncharacterized membrane protein YdjX (TVP38/TMEM64 family)
LQVIGVAFLLPVVAFVLLGEGFETRIQQWVQQEWSHEHLFWLIVLVLSVDILLPIPSSGVSTYAGGALGVTAGTLASWVGMTLGATLGFALAKLLGHSFVDRFGGRDVRGLKELTQRYGDAALIVTRPLPILAEACVLLLGISRLSWRRFLPPIILTNLAISATYATCGAYFVKKGALPAAIAVAVLLPLILTLAVRHRLRRSG